MKKRSKIITAVAIVAAIGIGGWALVNQGMQAVAQLSGQINTTPLAKMDLKNSVSATGTVQSVDSRKVYAMVSGNVKTVAVSVGDQVNEGDLLCQLDTEGIELDILSTKTTLNNSLKSSKLQLDISEKKYETAKENLESGKNNTVVTAQNAVDNAKRALDQAQEKHKEKMGGETKAESNAAEDLEKAKEKLEDAKTELRRKKAGSYGSVDTSTLYEQLKLLKETDPTNLDAIAKVESQIASAESADTQAYKAWQNEIKAAENAVKTAEDGVRSAERKLEDSGDNVSEELKTLKKAVDDAQYSYDKAVEQLMRAEESASNELQTYIDNIETNQLSVEAQSQKVDLQKLQRNLTLSTITAPISGVITAVYAAEGAPANGLLFVIENTAELEIATKIKEYDLGMINTGMKALIKSDATGTATFDGTISEIAPTAQKAADGSTMSGTNVEFDTKVAVDSADSGLRIGMNTRLTIVTEEKNDVYAVPYDAVTSREDDTPIVYTSTTDEKGVAIVKEIPVTIGMETDFYIEISGEGLSDGLPIVTNPEQSNAAVFAEMGSKSNG